MGITNHLLSGMILQVIHHPLKLAKIDDAGLQKKQRLFRYSQNKLVVRIKSTFGPSNFPRRSRIVVFEVKKHVPPIVGTDFFHFHGC